MQHKVYQLWHVYEVFQDGIYLDFEVFIGLFSTEEKCQAAIAELLLLGYFAEKSDKFEYYLTNILDAGEDVGWESGFFNPSEEEQE